MNSCQDQHCGVARYLETLSGRAIERHGVPGALSSQAAAITLRRFGAECAVPLNKRDEARIRAYFYAIVRRRAISSRGQDLRELRSRFLLSSIAADLMAAGRSGQEIFEEIARDYAASVEPATLRALELRLCGRSVGDNRRDDVMRRAVKGPESHVVQTAAF